MKLIKEWKLKLGEAEVYEMDGDGWHRGFYLRVRLYGNQIWENIGTFVTSDLEERANRDLEQMKHDLIND